MRTWHAGRALLLIMLLTAGLFTMHTIGHLSAHHATPLAAGPHNAHAHEPAPAPEAAPAPHDPGLPTAPLMVCLAVLLALVTLVFGLPFRARLELRGLHRKLIRMGITTGGRGPPVPRIGLLIADLSILRT